MRAASQLCGRGPLMCMMHLHINQKSDYDDDAKLHTKSKLKEEHYLSMFSGGIIRERAIIGIYIVTCPGL